MKGKQISAQVVGMALAVIIVWMMRQFAKLDVPAEVAVAFGTVASVGVSLMVPDDKEAE